MSSLLSVLCSWSRSMLSSSNSTTACAAPYRSLVYSVVSHLYFYTVQLTHIRHWSSYLLLLAGDVERNPGPIRRRDEKPQLCDLLCMSYTNVDRVPVDFGLMDRIKPRLTRVAIALRFSSYSIEVLKQKNDPECYLLSEWLSGRSTSHTQPASDRRPLTWGTLITALRHAGLMEEVRILEEHFIVTPVETVSRSAIVHTSSVSDHRDNIMIPDLVHHPEGGYMLHNGLVEVSVRVGPGVPKELVPLMKSYADMLVEFRKIELHGTKFRDLKTFFSGLGIESIEQCETTDKVIESLNANLYLHFFNIEVLELGLDYFHNSEVKTLLIRYRKQLNLFLSNCSVQEFMGDLKTVIRDSSKVETVTVKLEENIAEYTLEGLRKLMFHLFGVLYKVLVYFGTAKGCVRVIWIVPTSLVSILREKAEQLSPEYLASKGVLELVIGLRIAPNEENDLHSKPADVLKQHPMGVDSSDPMIAAIIQKIAIQQSELSEKLHREMETLVSTSSKHKQQLERQLDMAKRSAQAEINQLKKELNEMKKKQPTEADTIKLKQFSLLGETAPEDTDTLCTAFMFYKQRLANPLTVDFHFVVVRDLEPNLQKVKQEYEKWTADTTTLEIRLDDDLGHVIQLYSQEEVDLWKILPLSGSSVPHISKASIRNYQIGRRIPHCGFELELLSKQVQQLRHKVVIGGVPSPTSFHIRYPQSEATQPSAIPPQSLTQQLSALAPDKAVAYSQAPKMPKLLKLVAKKIPNKWHQLGILLGIDIAALHIFEAQTSDPVHLCMMVFDQWRKEQKVPFTWDTIIITLEKADENSTADGIRKWLNKTN